MPGDARLAVEVLYRDHCAPLRWFVYKIVGDAHDADEITQQSFERLLTVGETRTAIENKRAYLYRIAGNLARNHLRRKNLERRQAPDLALQESISQQGQLDPERGAVQNERRFEALQAAIEALPPKCKAAFVLCKLKGLTYAQAAQRLGVSSHMIKKHLQRGMTLCAARLRDAGSDSGRA